MAVTLSPKNTTKAKARVMGIIVALLVVVIVVILMYIAGQENRKTVRVVRIKDGDGIAANTLITEDNVEAYDMYYKEFEQYGTMKFSDGKTRSKIVLWEDKDYVLGKRYAAYFMRGGTLLFYDSTIIDQTRKNSYLYSMEGELLNIRLNTTRDFGDMVMPGDLLNIRCEYTDTNYYLPSEEEYLLAVDSGAKINNEGTPVTIIEPLFEEVQVLDMLNSDGNSIFDIYYAYVSMTKEQQQQALEDDAFLDSVTPDSILLQVTAEEVEHYMKVNSAGATYQITLLPRTSANNTIVDSLVDIQEALAGIAGLK